jgi:hypothetical protein
MRKYIKSMREQFDNNSVIFHQAKRMFHYEPSAHHPPHKSTHKHNHHQQRFRDDCSTVKDGKGECQSLNEINESSWIAKLVNGIQEHSLQDSSLCEEQKEKIREFRSIKSENVVVITQEEEEEPLPLKNITNHLKQQYQLPSSKYHPLKNQPIPTHSEKSHAPKSIQG